MAKNAFLPADTIALRALFGRFTDVADQLAMPVEERIGIAGVSLLHWEEFNRGCFEVDHTVRMRCARRLTYSLPLLHQILLNRQASAASQELRSDPRRPGGGVARHFLATFAP